MRRIGPILALVLVAVVDAVVLFGVAWNRGGEAESTLVLTERELPIGYVEKENTGLWLRLSVSGGGYRWMGAKGPREPPAWSTPEKLEELGFDCSVKATDPSADLFYSKTLPLERYAVVEYEGESWREWVAANEREVEDLAREVERGEQKPEALERAREKLEADRRLDSRLFFVDVGRDPDELRRRYPDRSRYIVAGTIVDLALRKPYDPRTESQGEPILTAYMPELLVDEIHVPHHLRNVLEPIRREDLARRESAAPSGGSASSPGPPRYEVTLKYGRRHEPWIADIHPIAGPAAPGARLR